MLCSIGGMINNSISNNRRCKVLHRIEDADAEGVGLSHAGDELPFLLQSFEVEAHSARFEMTQDGEVVEGESGEVGTVVLAVLPGEADEAGVSAEEGIRQVGVDHLGIHVDVLGWDE